LYLAYATFQKSKSLSNVAGEGDAPVISKASFFKDYMVGIVVTLANPLVILFYSALIPTVFNLSDIDMNGLFVALFVIFSVHFVLLTAQCALAVQVRVLLLDKVTVQKVNMISAGLLLCVAGYILFSLKDAL